MKYILLVMLLAVSISFGQVPTEPVEPAYPAPLQFQHSKIIEINAGQSVDIKSYLPANYSYAGAEFDPIAEVNGVKSVRVLFPKNDVPIVVTGPTTMTLYWND